MMDDLISRKSLYDKMVEAEDLARQRVIDTPSSFPGGALNPAYIRYLAQVSERTRFKELIYDEPAVQTAQPEIIRCKDCKYGRGDIFDRGLWCALDPSFDPAERGLVLWECRKAGRMTREEASTILRNTAWLGSNAEREKVEEAIEVLAEQKKPCEDCQEFTCEGCRYER